MSDMTDERAAEVLAAHNEWRRYDGETGVPGAPEMGDPTELGHAIDHAVSRLRSQPPAEAHAQGGGEYPMTEAEVRQWIDACNHEPARQVLRDYLRLRTAPPSAPLGNSGAVSALRVLSDFNPGADEFTDALSCLRGYFEQEIQSDQLNDLSDAIELPDGFRVVEHLPGIWEYQFDIEDESDEDSDRMCSGTSWCHPAFAAVAAWKHAYDEARSQPPSAPVGVYADWYRYNKPAPRWEDTKFGTWLDPGVYGPPRVQHGYSLEVAGIAQQTAAVDGEGGCVHGCVCGCCRACKRDVFEPVRYAACDCTLAAKQGGRDNG